MIQTKRCFIKGMLAFFVLLLASCASRKVEKVSLPADFKGPKPWGVYMGWRLRNMIIYSCTTKAHVGWACLIVWAAWASKGWIAPDLPLKYTKPSIGKNYPGLRPRCWRGIARGLAGGNCKRGIWYSSIPGKTRKPPAMWAFIWRMGDSSMQALPRESWSAAWASRIIWGHGFAEVE